MQVVQIQGIGLMGKDVSKYLLEKDGLQALGRKKQEFLNGILALSIDTMLMIIDPQKIRITNGIFFEFIGLRGAFQVYAKDIIKIEEDSEELILMVTTFKRGTKTTIIILLERPLNLADDNDFQTTKFKFKDFLKSKDFTFDRDEISKSYRNLDAETRIFNNVLCHYVDRMLHGMNKLSLEDFKELLSEPNKFVGLCSLCQKSILDVEAEKHNCKSCAKVCRMKCSLCKMVFYCDQDCQKSDWENHKTRCDELAQARADRQRMTSKFEELILKRTNVSPSVTFKKFYKLQRKKIYFESRPIPYLPEQIPSWELNEVD